MSPFLTTDQSRQIIQSALTDGYTGKTFDTVTSFMSTNLRDMNLSVAQSIELLRKNVNEGGQSIAGLSANLGILKEMSKDGNKSLPELQAQFMGTSQALMGTGMSGPQAERAALLSSNMFSGEGDRGIKDMGTQITERMMSSPTGLALMSTMGGIDLPKGLMPGAAPFLMTGDQAVGASQKVVGDWAKRLHARGGSPPKGSAQYANNVLMFHRFLQRMGVQASAVEAQQYYDRIVYEGRDASAETHAKTEADARAQTSVQSRNPLSAMGGGTVSQIAATGSSFKDTIGTLGTSIADLVTGNWGDIPSRFGGLDEREKGRQEAVRSAGSLYSIPMIDQIIKQTGPRGFEILDENGKPVKLNRNDRAMMDKISSGEYTWRPKGSDAPGIPLSQTPQAGDNFKDRVTEVQGTLRIEMDPTAQRAGVRVPGTIRLTPHERKANMGYGDAMPNNAPPGEDPITRGRSGW